MKTLISLLVILSATTASAKPDCSYNEYGLTRQSMVMAFDQSLNRFSDITAQLDEGQFYFNELRDPSCYSVIVRANEVNCITRSGQAIPVGSLRKVIGTFGDWQYHSVNWKQNVRIAWKYEELRGCMYGPAL